MIYAQNETKPTAGSFGWQLAEYFLEGEAIKASAKSFCNSQPITHDCI
jgi:hypothetical protein